MKLRLTDYTWFGRLMDYAWLHGPGGVYHRYRDTDGYCGRWTYSKEGSQGLDERYRKDIDLIKGATFVVAVGLAANGYRSAAGKDSVQKTVGHFAKGYAASMLGQGVVGSFTDNRLAKYLSGLCAAVIGSGITEKLERMGALEYDYKVSDMGNEMFGAYAAAQVGGFLDKRMAIVRRYLQKEQKKNEGP